MTRITDEARRAAGSAVAVEVSSWPMDAGLPYHPADRTMADTIQRIVAVVLTAALPHLTDDGVGASTAVSSPVAEATSSPAPSSTSPSAHDAIRKAAHDVLCMVRKPHADHAWVSRSLFFDEVADAIETALSAAGYNLTDDGATNTPPAVPSGVGAPQAPGATGEAAERASGAGNTVAAPSSPHLTTRDDVVKALYDVRGLGPNPHRDHGYDAFCAVCMSNPYRIADALVAAGLIGGAS